MKRRVFISLALSSILLNSKTLNSINRWDIVEDIQNTLFPKSSKFPSASDIGAIEYLKMVSRHNSFDKEDLNLIYSGVDRIIELGYKKELSKSIKNRLLKDFSKTNHGKKFTSTLIYYTIEATFSSPIYGGNKDNKGYLAYNFVPGVLKPQKPFGKYYEV